MADMRNQLFKINDASVQQFYAEKTITVAANGRFTDYTTFNYFRVLSLTGTGLEVIFGKNLFQTPFTGAGLGVKLEYVLSQLEFINTSGAPLTITYGVAIGQINDDRLNVSGTVTVTGNVSPTTASVLNSVTDVTLTPATQVAIIAANTSRRGVIITNIGSNTARIGDATNTGATRGAQLLANQSITLETFDAIDGYSTSGTSVSVLEY